jgi:hypothetical protein
MDLWFCFLARLHRGGAAGADFTFNVNPATNTFTYSDAQRTFGGIFISRRATDLSQPSLSSRTRERRDYSRPKANEMSAWA